MKSRKHLKTRLPKDDQNTNIVIVDCSTLAYAAFFSYGHLSYGGDATGVIFGFFSKLLLIAEQFNTNRFVFCWDSKGKLHREKDYTGYKEKRREAEKTPEEIAALNSLMQQRDELRIDSLPQFGFRNSFIAEGFEADDLLAVFARKLCPKASIIMVTTDADMYQCLDCCCIYDPRKKKIFSEAMLRSEYNISPNLWPLAKAIGGCDGDGVVGIVGVSDPKKNTSKGLKYLNGELTKGKIFDRIKSKEGQEIIAKNLPIVTTPYRGDELPRMIMRRDKFSIGRLISTFERYGFYSFLKKEKLEKWKQFFLQQE